MQLFEEVAIVSDRTNADVADALRRVLESFCLRVHYYQLVQRRQAVELFGNGGPRCDYTIFVAHGFSDDQGPAIRFDIRDNPSADPNAVEGWFLTTLDLRPELIREMFKHVRGTYVTNACGGGHEALAEAFLDVGCSAYIGSTESGPQTTSTMLFVIGLFYFLQAEVHDYAPHAFTLEEAVNRASGLHADWPGGTGAFRCYTKDSR